MSIGTIAQNDGQKREARPEIAPIYVHMLRQEGMLLALQHTGPHVSGAPLHVTHALGGERLLVGYLWVRCGRLDVCSLSALCRELIEDQEWRRLPTASLLTVRDTGAPSRRYTPDPRLGNGRFALASAP